MYLDVNCIVHISRCIGGLGGSRTVGSNAMPRDTVLILHGRNQRYIAAVSLSSSDRTTICNLCVHFALTY